MKISCENCGIQHELDPPAWVLSSGRAFRFRCAGCGHSQSVQPSSLPVASPMRVEEDRDDALSAPRATLTPSPAPVAIAPTRVSPEPASSDQLYLKQSGQVYMVKDIDTLNRWIVEGRVERGDLVSQGGVHWGPVEANTAFAVAFARAAAEMHELPQPIRRRQAPDSTWGDDVAGIPLGLPPLAALFAPPPPAPPLAPPLAPSPVEVGPPPAAPPPPPPPRASSIVLDDDDSTLNIAFDDLPGAADHDESVVDEDSVRPAPLDLPLPALASMPPAPLLPDPEIGRVVERNWGETVYGSERPLYERAATPEGEARDFEGDWDAPRAETRSRTGLLALIGVIAVFLVLGAVWWAGRTPEAPLAPGTPPIAASSAAGSRAVVSPPAPSVVAPAPQPAEPVVVIPQPPLVVPQPPVVVPAPQPIAAPRPVAAPSPVAAPHPIAAPGAVPSPEPRPAPRQSLRTLIDRGWNSADTDPAAASALFEQALAINGGSYEAMYGFGYARLKAGDASAAAPWLCKARAAPELDIQREVNGLLAQNAISCP